MQRRPLCVFCYTISPRLDGMSRMRNGHSGSLLITNKLCSLVSELCLGLPDAFCKNTGHFVNGDKSRQHS